MTKKKKSSDINTLAYQIANEATRPQPDNTRSEKNPAAVALGRLGGLKGGKARAAKLSPKKRKEIASAASKARWAKSHKP